MNPLSLLSGVWGYVAAAVVAAGLAAGATYYVVHNADVVTLQKVELAQSQAQTKSVASSLNQLQVFISNMHAADSGYNADLSAIHDQFAALEKEFANATVKPLPADCRPDAGRMQLLTGAVAAANAGASAGK